MPTAKAAPKIERAFWDTGAIVPLCCHQDASQEMRRSARRIKRVAAWWGTTVKARSAFSRLVRDGKMTARGSKQAVARLEVQRASWIEVLPSDRAREIAETLPEQVVEAEIKFRKSNCSVSSVFVGKVFLTAIHPDYSIRHAAHRCG